MCGLIEMSMGDCRKKFEREGSISAGDLGYSWHVIEVELTSRTCVEHQLYQVYTCSLTSHFLLLTSRLSAQKEEALALKFYPDYVKKQQDESKTIIKVNLLRNRVA